MMRARDFALIGLAGLSLTCRGGKNMPPSESESPRVLLPTKPTVYKDGVVIRVEEGREATKSPYKVKVAKAEPLSEAQTKSLLSRLAELKSKSDDKTNFALRPSSKPAPRTGKTVNQPFPPPEQLNPPKVVADTSGPLTIRRAAPEGKVPIAARASITFSQPMVAVASHKDSVKSVPAKLSPMPAGNWRWIGTRTLLFDPDGRMPQATRYTLTVPAGTKSASGRTLKKEFVRTFETPAPKLETKYPTSGPHGLNPVIVVGFDQAIDAYKVASHVRVEAGGRPVATRAPTPEEIAKDEGANAIVKSLDKAGKEDRYIVLTPKAPLPKDTKITVIVPANTPSAEGPLKTPTSQDFNFRTYAPLTLVKAQCNWRNDPCHPTAPWTLEFNNPLPEEVLDNVSLVISPDLWDKQISNSGNIISMRGVARPNSSYDVTIPAGLKDTFGQSYGKTKTVTFKIGDYQPQMFGPPSMVTLDPFDKKDTLDVHVSKNPYIEVRIYDVEPSDLPKYYEVLNDYSWPPQYKRPPGKLLLHKKWKVDGDVDDLTRVSIHLDSYFKGKPGHLIVDLRPTNYRARRQPRFLSWVQKTNLGINVIGDDEDLIVIASELKTGKPIANVDVSITGQGAGKTNAQGQFRLKKKHLKGRKSQTVQVKRGVDSAFISSRGVRWNARTSRSRLLWHVFDDRHMYRPGETVSLKGWVRSFKHDGDTEFSRVEKVKYKVRGPRGNTLKKGVLKVGGAGDFDMTFKLPKTPNLGSASVQFRSGTDRHYHRFQIEEFRRPEYEVAVEASPGPHIVGKPAKVSLSAKYFSGGGLPGADVNWRVSTNGTSFTPPNREKFQFGVHRPFWMWRWGGDKQKDDLSETREVTGKTNALGKHFVDVTVDSIKPAQPLSVVAYGTVEDVNRQRWSANASLLIHPSDNYIGLRSKKHFYQRKEDIEVEAIGVDHDGKAVSNLSMELTAVRTKWVYKNGKSEEVEKDKQVCKLISQQNVQTCKFKTPEGGRYKITGVVADGNGRLNRTVISTWVAGGKVPQSRDLKLEKLTIVPDKDEYKPGDVAKLLVTSPFTPATGIVTVQRGGIVSSQTVTVTDQGATVKVPIKGFYSPNLYVQVDVAGQAERVDDQGEPVKGAFQRPAHASGTVELKIPPKHRELKVSLKNPAKVSPGEDTSALVSVTHGGKPVKNADVALIVVDESVWSLSNYSISNPLGKFYPHRYADVREYRSRDSLRLADPKEMSKTRQGQGLGRGGGGTRRFKTRGAMKESETADDSADMDFESANISGAMVAPSGLASTRSAAPAMSKQGASQPAIGVRTNFDALATFVASATTNSKGQVRLSFTMPDNLTRYRVVAVVASGPRLFGKGESHITARLPLMVRPSPPRFLNFGDRFEMPVVVQNQTDRDMIASVAIRATNASFTKGQGRKIKVPANDRVEVRFPASAEKAGTARFQVAAASGSSADSKEFALPVWTPATTEAFATYGHLDKGAMKQPVSVPSDAVRVFGGLEVTTSSTQLQALTDAFLYLVRYPYECAEQRASRVLSIAALRDVLTAFKSDDMPSKRKLESFVNDDLEALRKLQNYDGGFAFWRRGHESWPFISLHVLHAYVRAENKGYKPNERSMRKAMNYAKSIERRIPSHYGEQARRAIIAYSLYIRSLVGDVDNEKAKKLLGDVNLKKGNLEVIGWLYNTFSAKGGDKGSANKIYRALGNRVTETAAAANFVSSYSDSANLILHSDRRADGVILEAMIAHKPKSDLIPKVVRGLLAHRKRGRWGNTQDNVFVLLAMDKYFNKYEKATPNFVSNMWLGGKFAGSQRFKGRSTDRLRLDVPMNYLATHNVDDVVLQKKGTGRLYYRIGMKYAPKSLKIDPSDHGFAVERVYEGADDASDVKQLKDGTWVVKSGSRIKITVRMVAESRRYHVALVDPMPAGFEALNPSLAVTEPLPQDKKKLHRGGWWWNRPWYEHQNMRDERVESFASYLPGGVHEYTYYARATTPGKFIVPPAKAEEMYHPETFGRSASTKVIVK